MNLGERQAYEAGRKDGWQEAMVALASGVKKLLGPESVKMLADALVAGLRDSGAPDLHGRLGGSSWDKVRHSAAPVDTTDPTEPANWANWGRSAIADAHEHIRRFDVVAAAFPLGWRCPSCGADFTSIFVMSGGTLAGGPYECQKCHSVFNRRGDVMPVAGAAFTEQIRKHDATGGDRGLDPLTGTPIGIDWHGTRPGDEDRHTVGEHR